jgi:hypothetical protein
MEALPYLYRRRKTLYVTPTNRDLRVTQCSLVFSSPMIASNVFVIFWCCVRSLIANFALAAERNYAKDVRP